MTLSSSAFSLRRMVAAAALAAAATLSAGPAAAEWPDRPVTIVVPYGPGAVNDLYARFIATKLTEKFGQPFVVDNKPGAASFVGTNYVARAEPDGYTFLEHQNIIGGLGQGTNTVQFNAGTDITSVAMIARSPEALLITAAIPAKDVREFFDYIKANPDKAFYGIGGLGSARHMLSDKLTKMMGVPMQAVNYNSGAQSVLDISQGRVAFTFGSVSTGIAHIEAGTIRVLAYAGEGATPDSPPAPTFKEQGIDFETYSWWGIFAPNGTPPDIVARMNEAVNEAAATPEFARLAAQSGASPHALTPEEFAEVTRAEVQRVNDLMQETGIRPPQ